MTSGDFYTQIPEKPPGSTALCGRKRNNLNITSKIPVHNLVNGLFFCHNSIIGGDPVNKLIARLIDCGMTREVALHMYGVYKRKGKLSDFEKYVESVEDSCREQMEVFQ